MLRSDTITICAARLLGWMRRPQHRRARIRRILVSVIAGDQRPHRPPAFAPLKYRETGISRPSHSEHALRTHSPGRSIERLYQIVWHAGILAQARGSAVIRRGFFAFAAIFRRPVAPAASIFVYEEKHAEAQYLSTDKYSGIGQSHGEHFRRPGLECRRHGSQ